MINNMYLKDSKGQALLFIIVAMTMALAVGVAISTRTLSSLRRTTTTDTATRVFSAAEGGVEWFLQQSNDILDSLADGNNNNGNDCPTGTTGSPTESDACILDYPPNSNDPIVSRAIVKVESFKTNNTSDGDHYSFTLEPGAVKEIELNAGAGGYFRGPLEICWKSLSATNSSGIYFLTYNTTSVSNKRLVRPATPQGTFDVLGSVVAISSTHPDYDDCYTITINNNLEGIRIKSLYAPSKVGVYATATSGEFPDQGYKITARGELLQNGEVKITKTVILYKSLPYLPAVFDNALYSEQSVE